MALVDILLDYDGFKQQIPDSLLSYLCSDTQILFGTARIPVSSIQTVTEKPLKLVRWKHDDQIFERVSPEVCVYSLYIQTDKLHSTIPICIIMFPHAGL